MSLPLFKKTFKKNTDAENQAAAELIEKHTAAREKEAARTQEPSTPPSSQEETPKKPALTFKKPYAAPSAGRRRKTKRSKRKTRKVHRK